MAVNWDYSNILLNNRSGANLARGIEKGGESIADGFRQYFQNKEKLSAISGQNEAILGSSPQLVETIDPALVKKIQEGKGTLDDHLRLNGMLNMSLAMEKQKQADQSQAQLSELRALQIAQEKQQQAETNRRMDEIAGINRRADVAMSGANTKGIYRPAAQADMMAFANSPAGQLRRQGVTLTPEMMMKTQGASSNFQPQEMMTPSGLPMVQTSPRSWIPDPRVKMKPEKDLMNTVQVGDRTYVVGPGNRYFDAQTGAPVQFGSNLESLIMTALLGKGSGAGEEQLSDKDKEALEWARAHPDDPRAAQILTKLGVQ